jgi:hypothetical protein
VPPKEKLPDSRERVLSAINEYTSQCGRVIEECATYLTSLQDAFSRHDYDDMTRIMHILFEQKSILQLVAKALAETASDIQSPVPRTVIPNTPTVRSSTGSVPFGEPPRWPRQRT